MKLATGLDEMPGRRGIPEVNWRRWSPLTASFWTEIEERERERESAGRMEKKEERVGMGEDLTLSPRGRAEKGRLIKYFA